MPKLLLTTILLSTVLTGCVGAYRPPPGSETAKARFITNTDDNTSFYLVDAKACGTGIAHTGVQMIARELDPVILGMAAASPQPTERTRERLLEANRRLDFLLISTAGAPGYGGYECRIGVGFIPRPNAEYEIGYHYDEAAGKCGGSVVRLESDVSGRVTRIVEPTLVRFHPPRLAFCPIR